MIRYNPKDWFRLIFHAFSREVFRKLIPGMLGIGVLTTGVCLLELEYLEKPFNISNTIHSLLGFVLSLFLVFRVNSAYDRWWEGRKQWGKLVNTCRMLAIRIRAMVPERDFAWFAATIQDFPDALKDHLRRKPDRAALQGKTTWDDGQRNLEHLPNEIALRISSRITELVRAEEITPEQQLLADGDVERLVDVLGACERILKTPIPYSYSMYMKKFIFIYVITLPLGFVATFEWWTIPVVMVVFYLLVAIELISEEIEDPFGEDDNDLPLDSMTETIRANVKEILGQA